MTGPQVPGETGAALVRLPVFLIHWEAPEWCASSARSILASEGIGVELVVIDNGQSSGPPLEQLLPPGTRIIPTAGNLHYSGGANVAIQEVRTSYPDASFFVTASHDLHVRPDTFRKLADVAAVEPDYGILAPALTSPFTSSGGVWNGWQSEELPLEDQTGLLERDWASGSCLFIRRECAEQVGRFDERFGTYMEDVDYCLRAKDAGWKIGVVAGSLMSCLGSKSSTAGPTIEANTIILIRKRRGTGAAVRAFGRVGVWMVKTALGSSALWRSRDRRAVSRAFLALHLRAARIAGRTWRSTPGPAASGELLKPFGIPR